MPRVKSELAVAVSIEMHIATVLREYGRAFSLQEWRAARYLEKHGKHFSISPLPYAKRSTHLTRSLSRGITHRIIRCRIQRSLWNQFKRCTTGSWTEP